MRATSRSTVVSSVLGVVLLGAMVAFTVGLGSNDDRSDTDPASAGATEEALAPFELPDELANDMVAVDLGTLPAELSQQIGDVSQLPEQEAAAAEGLARVFGVPGEFRVYAAPDVSALANVTVLDKAPGLFIPGPLPVDPSVLGVTRAASELVDVDGATCSITWGQEIPAGQPIDPTVTPQSIRCQLGAGQRTFEVTATGLSVDDAVAILQGLADSQ